MSDQVTEIDEFEPQDPALAGGEGNDDPTKQAVQPSKLESAVETLTKTVTDLAKSKGTSSSQQQQAKQPTQEELDEFWAVYNPTKTNPNFFKELFNLPDDVDPKVIERIAQNFASLQKGLVRQSVVSSRHIHKEVLDKLEERLKLAEDYISRSEGNATRSRFFESYPGLQDKRYNAIINMVASSLAEQEFDSEESYFKALAEGAATSLKDLDPEFSLESAPKQKTAATTPRLPRSGVGGGGGAGKQTVKKEDSSDASEDIFAP